MAESTYTPPEGAAAKDRALGKQLMLAGAVLVIAGAVGTMLSVILKVVWLGILGGPIGFLSGLALVPGIAAFVYGYTKIKGARRFADR
jgi:hypothetical protein